jgi:hypothetical protein
MGWVGPANWARLSHRKGWADFGPILFIYFFRAGLNPAQNFGLGQTQPGPTSTACAVGVNYNSRHVNSRT